MKGIIMRKFVKGCLELDYNIKDLEDGIIEKTFK
jgi:hypothetical protein